MFFKLPSEGHVKNSCQPLAKGKKWHKIQHSPIQTNFERYLVLYTLKKAALPKRRLRFL